MKLIMENWERFLNKESLTEDEGPEQAISRWAQMFPLERLATATAQDPEMDVTIDASPLAPLGMHPGDPGVYEE